MWKNGSNDVIFIFFYTLLYILSILASCFPSEAISDQCWFAILAEGFGGSMMLESLYHGLRSWWGENLFEWLMEEIAEDDITVVVEAAGDETSIGQNSYLLEQCLAEYFSLGRWCICWRPFELSVKLQIDIVAEAESIRAFLPRAWYVFSDVIHHLLVLLVHSSLVP